ncbi:phage head closure protein [Weissella paramesenteroides]|uniref:phage head closure protein n=1 Tax=Weissella paramesenteroides TaxID=1249 RepID=UPI003857DF68
MAQQLFKPSDLVHKVVFEKSKTDYNPVNGNPIIDYETLFTKWGAPKRRTITQQYQIAGTSLEDTIVIGVRHDERIIKGIGVFYDGVHYDIEDVSADDSNNYITYDLITVKEVKKNG